MGLFSSKYKTYAFWNTSKLYDIDGAEYRDKMIQAAILQSRGNDDGLYKNFARQALPSKKAIIAYNNIADVSSQPTGGISINNSPTEAQVKTAIDAQHPTLGGTGNIYVDPNYYFYGQIPEVMHYAHDIAYVTADGDYDWENDTITYEDPNDLITYTNWEFFSVEEVVPDDGNHDVTLVRSVDALTYWIEGPEYIVEGNTRSYDLKLNRVVDAGKELTLEFVFSHSTFVAGVDYVLPSPITFAPGEDTKAFNIEILDNPLSVPPATIDDIEAIEITFNIVELPEFTFVDTDVDDVTNDEITITGHGAVDNDKVRFYGADLPDPLVEDTVYFVIYVDDDTIQVEPTIAGGAIDLLDPGTGTHTAKFGEPGTGSEAYSYITGRPEFEIFELAVADQTGTIINIPHITVAEANTTVDVELILEQATSAFSVEVYTIGESAVPTYDYVEKIETLNFLGNAGEIQTFTVTITVDLDTDGNPAPLDDDFATIRIGMRDCTNGAVNIDFQGEILITDNTDPAAGTDGNVYLTLNRTSPPIVNGFFTEFWTGSLLNFPGYAFLAYEDTVDPAYTPLFTLDGGSTITDFLPSVNIRHNGDNTVDTASAATIAKYNSMLRLFTLSLNELTTAFTEGSEDLSTLDEVDFEIKCNIGTPNKIVSEILYKQFYQYIDSPLVDFASDDRTFLSRYRPGATTTEHMNWGKTEYAQDVVAVVTDVGDYHLAPFNEEITIPFPFGNTGQFLTIQLTDATNFVLSYQKSATLCDQITITGLRNELRVDAPQTSRAKPRWIVRTLIDDIQVPVTYGTILAISPFNLIEAYPYLYTLDSTSVQVVKVKWYQQKWFKILLIVVRVVIAVFTLGASEGVFSLIYNLVIQQLLFYGLGYLLEALGVSEFITALVIAVVSTVAISGFDGLTGLMNAEALTQFVSDYSNYVSRLYAQSNEDIADDLLEAQEEYEERSQEIEDTRSQLSSEKNIFMYSPQSMNYMAIDLQYNYDLLFDYNRVLDGFLTSSTRAGVI